MEIKVRLSRTADDFNKAFKVRASWRNWVGVLTIIVFLGVIVVPALQKGDNDVTRWSFIMVAILLAFAWQTYLRGRIGRKLLKKNPGLGREEEVTFSDEGIHATTATGESRASWSHYTKATITKDMILIYPNLTAFICYPRRAFTDEQYSNLTGLIKSKIADTKEQ